MSRWEFKLYRAQFVEAMRKILAEEESEFLDEASFPAYANPNPVMSFLFWERIRVVMKHLELRGPFDLVLDFGCGSGVMLPFLARKSAKVVAFDVNFFPLRKISTYIQLSENVEILNA